MTNIKNIFAKNEAVITNNKMHAARALQNLEDKKNEINNEIRKPIYSGLLIKQLVFELIELVTNASLAQEQRVRFLADYRTELLTFLRDVTKVDDKLAEAEKELNIKEEDIQKLTKEIQNLRNQIKLGEDTRIRHDILNKRERVCKLCGRSLKGRSVNAMYCLPCSEIKRQESLRVGKAVYEEKRKQRRREEREMKKKEELIRQLEEEKRLRREQEMKEKRLNELLKEKKQEQSEIIEDNPEGEDIETDEEYSAESEDEQEYSLGNNEEEPEEDQDDEKNYAL